MYAVRVLAGAACALALPALTPQSAGADSFGPSEAPPSAVVIRTQGRIAGGDEWFSFESNGTALRDGPVDQRYGHYRARVDYAPVARIATDAHFCSRPMSSIVPAIASDVLRFSVDVRCGNRWRVFFTGGQDGAQVGRAVRALSLLSDGLSWAATGEANPPDSGVREATSS